MQHLIDELRAAVGRRNVLTGSNETRWYRQGYRHGGGDAVAVVKPGTLLGMWRALQACHEAGVIVIMQAANTGLTGGSTPVAAGYDRPVVIVSTLRLSRLELLHDGEQVLCQPGVTLDQLERALRPIGREPHSVIGSSCIGASVTGGVCNNSGGSLIRRGPAYTQLALYAQITAGGQLALVNHLGIDLGDSPEEILTRLDEGKISSARIRCDNFHASDHEYCNHVRDIDSAIPARFNADPRRLYEASGSAGRLAVFALRLDTFAADKQTQVFYIGSNGPDELESIRRDILAKFDNLPIAGEYMHRSAYEASKRHGKDLFLFIQAFGTDKVPLAFALKSRFDGIAERLGLGSFLSDRILQFVANRLPDHLPARLNAFRDRYEHHLLLRMGDDGIEEARSYLADRFPSSNGDYFECSEKEGKAAFLNRFCVGGAVVRYRAVHQKTVEDIVALDIALPRNTLDWFEQLPDAIGEKIDFTMYCGHFFCHVFHQEYLVKKGHDCAQVKSDILALLKERGATYPAEHNVGHQYEAEKALADFYRALDPTNSFNPGIGGTSTHLNWKEPGYHAQLENEMRD